MKNIGPFKIWHTVLALALVFTASAHFQLVDKVLAVYTNYTFSSEVKMVMEMHDEKGELTTMNFDLMFSPDGGYYGLNMEMAPMGTPINAQSVISLSDNKVTTLINQAGMKMGMEYDLSKPINMPGGKAATKKANNTEVSYQKTGKTKTIAGYTCNQYTAKANDDSYTEIWTTKELSYSNFYESFSKINQQMGAFPKNMPEGFVMELSSWPEGKDDKEKYQMQVVSVNKSKAGSISTDGYTIMKVN